MIRVLIADDSPTARSLLIAIFSADPELSVVGEAVNGLEAVEMTRKLRPDLVTMDIRMPRMDGLEATKEIMIENPTPILIVSSSKAVHDVEMSMQTLRVGALAILEKPAGPGAANFEETARELIAHVKAMAHVKLVRHWRPRSVLASAPKGSVSKAGRVRIVAIAASTGGPAALNDLLAALPADFPAPVLVVQHISRGFVRGLAEWLDRTGPLRVKIAEAGEALKGGVVYFAPDDHHLGVAALGQIVLSTAPPISGFRPSGTFLFESIAKAYGALAAAVILTGMGEDGVAGLRAVRQAGGRILAQDEKTSVIFGMPAAAIQAGLADDVLPIDEMAGRLVELIAVS